VVDETLDAPAAPTPSADADAANAAPADAASEKVDAMTYVFGAPGELERDLAMMGTSPRRLALYTSLGLGIGLAGDLWGITSALLRAAPPSVQDAARRAKLDTYYPVGDFKRYIDDEYRYEFRYPARWLADQAVYVARAQARAGALATDSDAVLRSDALRRTPRGPAALAAFGPPGGTFAENLSVFRSPVPPNALDSLGAPADAARRLLDTAIAPPSSGKTTVLLGASPRADGLAFEYTLQLPNRKDGSPGRVLHNLAEVAIRGRELYTLTILCPESEWADREALFRQVASSFKLN